MHVDFCVPFLTREQDHKCGKVDAGSALIAHALTSLETRNTTSCISIT